MILSIANHLFRNTMIVAFVLSVGYIGMCSEKTVAEARPMPKSAPAQVIANYDAACVIFSKGESAPEGKFPFAAIVQDMNDGARFTGVPREVSMAFERSVGARKNIPFRVLGMCY